MDLFDPWATRLGIETDSCYFLLPAAQRVRAIRSDITALKEFKLNVINYFGASPLPSHSYLEALALGGTVIVFGESWKPQAVEEVRMLATEKLFFFSSTAVTKSVTFRSLAAAISNHFGPSFFILIMATYIFTNCLDRKCLCAPLLFLRFTIRTLA